MPEYATLRTTLTIGTRRVENSSSGYRDYRHIGVLRAGVDTVAECGHEHTNRDCSTKTNGTSAADCIRQAARAADKHDTYPAIRESLVRDFRNGWQRLRRGGFSVPTGTIERAKQESAAKADAYDALIGHLIDLLADDRYQR